ncbi:facilitated trehalose transporter Tret1 [Anoplophora glabripennis]|nr:facilitated trehalose transporter Tret1 [Anoplophora glabripennis]
MKRMEKCWEFGPGRMALAAFCAHSVSISIGICQGYSAILIPQLQASTKMHVTTEETSWLASLGAITNPVGSVLSGVLAEYFGRRRSIQISSIPFIIGWILIGIATDINWLYAGRLISGISAGMSTACYTYVSEISTPESRGFLQALGPICASFGILLTYTLGYYIRWSTVALISVTFGIFSMVTIHFLPESPGYLLKNNRTAEGFEVYLWFRRNNVIAQQEIDSYHENLKQNKSDGTAWKEAYLSPQTVKPFFILVILFLLQEFSGIYTLLFYAVSFFEETDLNIDDYISSIIVGIIRFTMSIVAAFLINKFGRKVLCTFSSLGMALTMLTVAIYVKYYELNPEEEKILSYLPLVGIIFNVVFSMIGMLPIPWILVGEMFPLEVRPIMSGVVICIAQTFIFICVKIYNDMLDYLNFSGTLLVFVAASIISIVFSKFVLPETKNKSLQEIEQYFRKNKGDVDGFDNKAFDMESEGRNREVQEVFTVRVDS